MDRETASMKNNILRADQQKTLGEDRKTHILASFSREDEKAIMRKVDNRFLVLIGAMYLIKN